MRKNFGVKPWFYPLPVLIIGTYNEDGTPNAMNAAWGGLYGGDQVVLCLSRAPTTRPPATSRHGGADVFLDGQAASPRLLRYCTGLIQSSDFLILVSL